MRTDRRFSGLLATLGAIGCCLVLSPGVSLAYEGYKEVPTSQFGEPCTTPPCGDGQFSNPTAIAVNDTTGQVYVIDKADNRVEYFSASGTYEGQFNGGAEHALLEPNSIAVDNSCYLQPPGAGECADPTGRVYVTDSAHGVLDIFGSKGEYLSQITGAPTGPRGTNEEFTHEEEGRHLQGVAVDTSGNIIVALNSSSAFLKVDEFTETGQFITGFENIGLFIEAGITVDTQDNIYLTEAAFQPGGGRLEKLNLQGGVLDGFEREGLRLHGTDVAVDQSSDNLFFDKESNIVEYQPFGEPFSKPVRTFGTGNLEESHGIAVNSATGTVYASEEQAGKIDVFPRVLFPTPAAVTGATQSVARTFAQVTGTVNPEELPTSYYYQYGPEIPGAPVGYGATTGALPVTAGVGSTPASGELKDLVPNTTYHYRLVAVSEAGTGYGEDHVFTTPANTPPSVSTGVASGVSAAAATIHGVVDPGGIPTTYEFQLGTDLNYGARVFEEAGAGGESEEVSLSVAGLQPATTYHYRLCASNEANAGHPLCGADATFTTAVVPSALVYPSTPPLLATPAIVFPKEAGVGKSVKGLTSAQKLKNALRSCGKKPKKQRAGCERAAHKRFGAGKGNAKAKRGK